MGLVKEQAGGVREEELVRTIIETHWQLRRANTLVHVTYEFWSRCKVLDPPPGGRCLN
jgi:hypothetical protein